MAMLSVVLRDKRHHDDAVAMAFAAIDEAPESMTVRAGPRALRPVRRIGTVEGFDMSAFNLLAGPGQSTARRRTQRIEACSEPATVLRMDYESPSPFGATTETLSLTSTGGCVDGILQWMRIDLGAGEMLENDPFAEGPSFSCGTALFDLPEPVETRSGDGVDVTFSHKDLRWLIGAVVRPGGAA